VGQMKIMVCGPIAGKGVDEIKLFQKVLIENGFQVVNQLKARMNYSYIDDFRNKKQLAKRIVVNDLKFIEKSDVIVAICNEPSFGTAIEIYYAKKLGKKVIVLNEEAQPSPWPIAFADQIVKSKDELIKTLLKLRF